MESALPKKKVLGVGVTNASESEILEFIARSLKKTRKKLHVATVNPEIIVAAYNDNKFRAVLNKASLGLSDGLGVIWAGKILGTELKERVTGVDLMEKLAERASKEGFVTGFLGGRAKIAERTAECLQQKYPRLQVGFVGEEWPERLERDDRKLKIEGRKSIDILFVAFGFPKQEFWIGENLPRIPARVAMGVGGAFDYISATVPRAPKLLRTIGLEWFFRLIVQPWRWKRQLALIEFVYLVLKELFAKQERKTHN